MGSGRKETEACGVYLLSVIVFALLLLTGCSGPQLTVYSRYHTPRELASYHVQTPDPRLHCINSLGQSLYLDWHVPKKLMRTGPTWIECYVRLRNLEERCFSIPITSHSGHTSWWLMGAEWFRTGGIFTFKATLICNDRILQQVEHPLYSKLILPSS